MPPLRMGWTPAARAGYADVRRRAIGGHRFNEFAQRHNEVIVALRDLTTALQFGEPLFHTRLPGGQVRQVLRGFLSVIYAVIEPAQIGWIIRYETSPEDWPF